MRRNKVSNRMTSAHVLLSIFFGVIILALMVTFVNAYVQKTEDSTLQVRLANVSKSIDVQIDTAQEVTNSLFWDQDILALASYGSENVSQTAICHAIQTRADSATAKNMSVYVSTLTHSMDTVYGAERSSSALSFLKSAGFGSVNAMDITDYFVQNSTDMYFRLMEQSSDTDGNTLAIVERKFYQNKPIYFFVLVNLNEFIYVESAADTMMIMADNVVLACSNYKISTPRNGIYSLLEEQGNINTMLGKTYVMQDYKYLVGKSEVMSWYYIIATPYTYFSQMRISLYLICLAVLIAIVLLAMLLGVLLKRYAYAPLSRTVRKVGAYTNARCEDEESYICDTIAACMAEKEALQTENNSYRKKRNLEHLRSMLRGIKVDEEQQRELVQYFCAEKDGPYRVCALEFSKYGQLSDAFSEEMIFEIRQQILDFIQQQLEDGLVAEPMVMDYKSFAVIATGIDMHQLRAKLMNVVATVSGSFEAELAGAVGDLCERLTDVGDSYASALNILDSHYSLGSRNSIVTSEDVAVGAGEGLYYPIETERELIAEVIRCHEAEVAELLTTILDENFDKHPLTKERLNSFAFSIASTVNRIADTLGKSIDEIFGEGNIVFLDLKMCTDKMEVRGKVYGMFNTLVEFIGNVNPNGERDISGMMLDYIHTHYNEDISLSDLSAEFSLSLSYTSTLFKEVTGENFKDYLNRFRIKRACDILKQEPSIKNTELARRVGCNTVATLLRLFNKYEGTTPGQYGKKEN